MIKILSISFINIVRLCFFYFIGKIENFWGQSDTKHIAFYYQSVNNLDNLFEIEPIRLKLKTLGKKLRRLKVGG